MNQGINKGLSLLGRFKGWVDYQAQQPPALTPNTVELISTCQLWSDNGLNKGLSLGQVQGMGGLPGGPSREVPPAPPARQVSEVIYVDLGYWAISGSRRARPDTVLTTLGVWYQSVNFRAITMAAGSRDGWTTRRAKSRNFASTSSPRFKPSPPAINPLQGYLAHKKHPS